MGDKNEIERPVSEAFKRFQDEFALALSSEIQTIRAVVETVRQSNGKHIRPLLLLLTAKACGQANTVAVNAAVSLELLHAASLIHDDVVDETKQRRGKPSINAVYDNRIAVLVGDFMYAEVMIRMSNMQSMSIFNIFAALCHEMVEGEIKQMENAEEFVLTEEDYFIAVKKKTATLLSSCTEIGAITANASAEVQQKCKEFGQLLGYCFQIKDDIFDYFEDIDIGKPCGNDLREGKVTLPLLYAFRVASPEEKQPCLNILQEKTFTPGNVSALLRFAKEKGGIQYAEACMRGYKDRAVEIIRSLPDSEARNSLLLLADYLIEREK
jgi:octaprenyl-diphosphate synthase